MKTVDAIERMIEDVPVLQEIGKEVARSIHKAILEGGEPTQTIADLLHGTWLGHPLHPVLTDIPIGTWVAATFFDLVAAASGDNTERAEYAADVLTQLGLVAALPTVITGLTDYSTVSKPALSTATLHLILMDVAFTIYLASYWQRRRGNRTSAVLLSGVALLFLTVGGYVGGHLAYKQRVGVDHSEAGDKPKEWTAVMNESELNEHEATRVVFEDNPILLYRFGGTVYAIDAVCSHAGGPLEDGKFDGFCVTCPWHDSVFDVRDGHVVHGPSTYGQPNYSARIKEGKIEVKVDGSG
jgi:nitrite reductase/ring-hydroxylating ferredoxin subunit/uncharacterized membrane protein